MNSNSDWNLDDLNKEYYSQLERERKDQLTANRPQINSFISVCRKKQIELTESDFNYVRTIGIVAKAPGIVTRLEAGLEPDKENLVSCKLLFNLFAKSRFQPGYLYSNDFVAMAHPYFRRGHYENNNFAPRFLEVFWGIEDEFIDSYLALDYDRVRIDVGGPTYLEADTWYGAPFNRDIAKLPNGISKLRPPTDLTNHHLAFVFGSTYSLDIKWEEKKGIKVFQAQELKSSDVQVERMGQLFHPMRYLHAEFDIQQDTFRHFDGAIQFLTPDEYENRRDSDLNYNRKSRVQIKSISEKLFKINGQVSVELWSELAAQFFTGNPLIIEYLSGSFPKHVNDYLETMRAQR